MDRLETNKPRFGAAKIRRAVGLTRDDLVRVTCFDDARQFLSIVKPTVDGVDAAAWARNNGELIGKMLLTSGAILFRNFSIRKASSFDELIRAASGELLEYSYRSTPRKQVEGRIYTSTEYPASESIPLHNEMAYARTWPMKVWFCCVKAALVGGETPLADSRRVLRRITPAVQRRFVEHGVLYLRNYGAGMDLDWPEVFQTESRTEVEQFCHNAGIEYEWRANGGLTTRQVCQAVAAHPRNGEEVWFNQAHLFHITSLPEQAREVLLSSYGESNLPRNTYYGDGSPIEPEVLDEIRSAYEKEATVFKWEEGDVLVTDNMLTAHGRLPYEGPRQILVGMTEQFEGQQPLRK